MSALGENLQKLRLRCDLSQEEVAEKLHKSSKTYSRYETGTIKPDIETLIELADLYCVSLDYLTGRVSSRDEWLSRYLPGFSAGQELANTIQRKRATKRIKKPAGEKQ